MALGAGKPSPLWKTINPFTTACSPLALGAAKTDSTLSFKIDIRGRDIPRMSENLKINGWALNTEYFSEIMHLLRQPAESLIYRHVVERLVDYPSGADTRDTEAILRLCTAYLKLLFPHVTKPDGIDKGEFKRYCLRPAVQMRTVIRQQLQMIDPLEFGGKNVAAYTLREVD